MKVKNNVTLFEFGYITNDRKASEHEHIQVISDKAYQYLKGICLSDERERNLLKLKSVQGMEVLQVQNYAGVLFTPDGTQLEILPKIGKKQSACQKAEEDARQSLLIMLKALKGFQHIQTSNANIVSRKMPLLEVFISQFLQSVNGLIKRGLRSDYVRQEDNLAFLKGKLNVGKQLRHNVINKHKFYCEYDEFLLDRPANRLIHAALAKVNGVVRSAVNQKLLQELMFVFHDVPVSHNHKHDFSLVALGRGMNHYELPLAWAKLVLDGFSPQTMKGDHHAASLLFPMERVFEDYVAQSLGKALKTTHRLKAQLQSKSLVTHNGSSWFKLKPDMVIEHSGKVVSVLDTKWKLLDSSKANGTDKYGLSQSDFYQMLAYGHHYFDTEVENPEMFLVYPSHSDFEQAISHSFDFPIQGEKTLKLWVVPFVISESNEEKGIRWSVGAKIEKYFIEV
ncbi:restriction endonuclease [Photobacterium kishitanii]|uniref:McrC family protein n=1 Tax=Photobacterium kishitanii TaxID=318456 RepID=UPI000D16142B|nr:McrC family protein [Photobacterium kishitanii]PSV15160.1 restriction endonuclease [Photobacterium kishitanii]